MDEMDVLDHRLSAHCSNTSIASGAAGLGCVVIRTNEPSGRTSSELTDSPDFIAAAIVLLIGVTLTGVLMRLWRTDFLSGALITLPARLFTSGSGASSRSLRRGVERAVATSPSAGFSGGRKRSSWLASSSGSIARPATVCAIGSFRCATSTLKSPPRSRKPESRRGLRPLGGISTARRRDCNRAEAWVRPDGHPRMAICRYPLRRNISPCLPEVREVKWRTQSGGFDI